MTTSTQTTCVDEDFINFSDWTDFGTTEDSSSSHFGVTSPCRGFTNGNYMVTPSIDYPTQLSFYQDASNTGDGKIITLDYKIGAGSWINLYTFTANKAGISEIVDLTNIAGQDLSTQTNVTIRFNSPSSGTWYLDDVIVDCGVVNTTPTILTSTTSITGFSYIEGSGPSVEISFTIEATNLTNNLDIITANNNHIFSTSSGGPYSTTISISPDVDGTIPTTTIYTILKSGLLTNNYDDTIVCGSNGATDVNINVDGIVNSVGGSCASELIISEYIEGSSNNKFIELYNGTGVSIDLTDYDLRKYSNGSSTVSNTLSLSGNLADNSTYIIENSSESIGVSSNLSTSNAVMQFNGDDVIELYNTFNNTSVDIIGEIGLDPGSQWGTGTTSTSDNTIIRKSTIVNGDTDGSNTFDPVIEWDGYATDDVSHLGNHIMTCTPCIEPTSNAVFISNSPQNITTTSATLN